MIGSQTRIVLYGILTVMGTVGTWYYNLQFMNEVGMDAGAMAFLDASMANAASSSMTIDILVAAGAGMLFFTAEGRRLGIRHIWAYMLFSCLIAFAAMFPLFLLMRERRLAALEAAGTPDLADASGEPPLVRVG